MAEAEQRIFLDGSFWIGELWQLYARTHHEKYRKWAELWGSKLQGRNCRRIMMPILYYYSSALEMI